MQTGSQITTGLMWTQVTAIILIVHDWQSVGHSNTLACWKNGQNNTDLKATWHEPIMWLAKSNGNSLHYSSMTGNMIG